MDFTVENSRFVAEIENFLNAPSLPSWVKVSDQSQPIFRNLSDLRSESFQGNHGAMQVGDQILVTAFYGPTVRLNHNIFVEFKRFESLVYQETDGRRIPFTGIRYWKSIFIALINLPLDERHGLKVVTIFKCTNNSLFDFQYELLEDTVSYSQYKIPS